MDATAATATTTIAAAASTPRPKTQTTRKTTTTAVRRTTATKKTGEQKKLSSVHLFMNPRQVHVASEVYHYKDEMVALPDGTYAVVYHGQKKAGRDHYISMAGEAGVPEYVYHGRDGEIRSLLGRVTHAREIPIACTPKKYWLIVEPIEEKVNEEGLAAYQRELAAAGTMSNGVRITGPYKKMSAMLRVGLSYDQIRDVSFGEGIVPVFEA